MNYPNIYLLSKKYIEPLVLKCVTSTLNYHKRKYKVISDTWSNEEKDKKDKQHIDFLLEIENELYPYDVKIQFNDTYVSLSKSVYEYLLDDEKRYIIIIKDSDLKQDNILDKHIHLYCYSCDNFSYYNEETNELEEYVKKDKGKNGEYYRFTPNESHNCGYYYLGFNGNHHFEEVNKDIEDLSEMVKKYDIIQKSKQ